MLYRLRYVFSCLLGYSLVLLALYSEAFAAEREKFTLSCPCELDRGNGDARKSYLHEYTIDLKRGKFFDWQTSEWRNIHEFSEDELSLQDERDDQGLWMFINVNRNTGEYRSGMATSAWGAVCMGSCGVAELKQPKPAKF